MTVTPLLASLGAQKTDPSKNNIMSRVGFCGFCVVGIPDISKDHTTLHLVHPFFFFFSSSSGFAERRLLPFYIGEGAREREREKAYSRQESKKQVCCVFVCFGGCITDDDDDRRRLFSFILTFYSFKYICFFIEQQTNFNKQTNYKQITNKNVNEIT